MIVYAAFREALDGVDLDDLAERSGVIVESIRAVAAGEVPPSLSVQMRLAAALDANPLELFRLPPAYEAALPSGADRYVTDPATLRAIRRPRPEKVAGR